MLPNTSATNYLHLVANQGIFRIYAKYEDVTDSTVKCDAFFVINQALFWKPTTVGGTPEIETPLDPLNCVLGTPQSTVWLKTYFGVAPAHS